MSAVNQTETAVLAAFDDAGELWRIELAGRPTDVVVVDGDLWVSREDGTLARIDPSDGRVLGQATIEPFMAVVGGFGSVWAIPGLFDPELSGPGRVVRIDPNLSTTSVELPRFSGECCPGGPRAGAGAVWVPLGDNGVAVIDPDTNEVTVIPGDDIGHEVTHIAVDGEVAYVASRHRVASIVDGDVRAGVSPGEIWYLGPMDGAFGVLGPQERFQVLRADNPMVVDVRKISRGGQSGPVAEVDGEAWMEIGQNFDLRRVEFADVP